jgi:broad specificity phosphatase PhoE
MYPQFKVRQGVADDFDFKGETRTLPNGETYVKVETEATLSDPANRARVTGNWNRLVKSYADKAAAFEAEGVPIAAKHGTAIRALRDWAKKLRPNSVPPPTCS